LRPAVNRDPEDDRDEPLDPDRADRFVGDGSELNFDDDGSGSDPFAGAGGDPADAD
jgi:hypothetical protein